MDVKSAIKAINQAGILLVFPLDNRKEPGSIWSAFFPRKKMRWEWDESGDNSVAKLWNLRADLSTTRQVIYSKWYRGRATYFSLPVFTSMLRILNPQGDARHSTSSHARRVLEILESESPVSTKELKRMAGLKGKANERIYEKALQELWSRLLIVAFGEVDEGAFPSLAVGSTRVLFDDLWTEAFKLTTTEAEQRLTPLMSPNNLFYRHFQKLKDQQAQGLRNIESLNLKSTPRRPVQSVITYEELVNNRSRRSRL